MMKHAGKARRSAFKILFWSLVLLVALCAAGVIATIFGTLVAALSTGLITLWLLFALFTLYFFRDPTPKTPTIPNAIVSPAQGKVDLIDETTEDVFMGGRCKRISIFLSVVDVHIQRAPITGRIVFTKHTLGKFLSATASDCGLHNENVLVGIEPADYPGQKMALRLIAGLIARRIVMWVNEGESVSRSERISLIQYGSRCDLYLPLAVKIHVKLGDKVKVGETIVASFE
jgi:phosphatidylserine decarboxylase